MRRASSPLLSALLYLLLSPSAAPGWRRYATGGLLALATFLLVGLPMLWYATTHFDDFQRRLAAVSEQREEAGGSLLDNGWAALRCSTIAATATISSSTNRSSSRSPPSAFCSAPPSRCATSGACLRIRPLGIAVSLLPGLLSVPNGNRGITAIPFVYLLIAIGLDAVLSHAAALLPRGARRVALRRRDRIAVAVAAFESYGEFLGPDRRPLPGISPRGDRRAQFMRRHRDRYRPYTISNWTDNTFIYLTHRPGDGPPFETPLAVRYDARRRSRARSIDGATWGSCFCSTSDRQPMRRCTCSRSAFPTTGSNRSLRRAVRARRSVGRCSSKPAPWRGRGATSVDHSCVRNGAGDSAAGATLCGEMIGDGRGVSAHVSLMVPQVDNSRRCPHRPLA